MIMTIFHSFWTEIFLLFTAGFMFLSCKNEHWQARIFLGQFIEQLAFDNCGQELIKVDIDD